MADYLIVGTLHVLAVNSVQSLYNYYSEQLEKTPSLADIRATNKLPEKVLETEITEDEMKDADAAAAADAKKEAKKEASLIQVLILN